MVGSGQIGDGPSDFEDAIVRACREPESSDRSFQELATLGVQFAVVSNLTGAHLSVAEDASTVLEALALALARCDDALAYNSGRFGRGGVQKILLRKARDFDVQIDPIEQWA